MASVSNDPGGLKRVLFMDREGRRRTIRLGKVSKSIAQSLKLRVERILAASIGGGTPDRETARWLVDLDDATHGKLAAAGLMAPRGSTTLGGWLEKYLGEKARDLKPESLRKLHQTEAKLLAYFTPETSLRGIKPAQAAEWRSGLKAAGLSEAAVKTHSGNAKGIMAEAKRRELVPSNPFALLKGGPTPSQETRYITPEETEAVLAACPDVEWATLFGLARLAGLRVPSETHRLTWADVDWERGRLLVRSPKTERWAGKDRREVPITPRLHKLLQDHFDEAEPGRDRLVSIGGKGAVHRRVRVICKRAGVEPWPRLWQTLRASCEKEWAMTFPQYAVSKWIGHSIGVSGRHYANDVPDELFDKAAQNAAQHVAESTGTGGKPVGEPEPVGCGISPSCNDLHQDSAQCNDEEKWSRGESNPRPPCENTGENDTSGGGGGAKSGAVEPVPPASDPMTDPDLEALIQAWPALPEAVKGRILGLVEGAGLGG